MYTTTFNVSISEVTKVTLLPLTITWLPLRMCVARSWNETLSMQWKTCLKDVNMAPLSSVSEWERTTPFDNIPPNDIHSKPPYTVEPLSSDNLWGSGDMLPQKYFKSWDHFMYIFILMYILCSIQVPKNFKPWNFRTVSCFHFRELLEGSTLNWYLLIQLHQLCTWISVNNIYKHSCNFSHLPPTTWKSTADWGLSSVSAAEEEGSPLGSGVATTYARTDCDASHTIISVDF